MPHLSIRLTDDDAERLAELLAAYGLGARGKSTLVRALIADAHARRAEDGELEPVEEAELHRLLSRAARADNVSAMRELRIFLHSPRGEAGGRGAAVDDTPKRKKDAFEELDEVSQRRQRRRAK